MRLDGGYIFAHVMAFMFLAACAVKEEDVIEDCIKDKSKPYSARDNYVDCLNNEETKQEGRTKCCEVDNKVGCCDAGSKSTLEVIGMGIGCTAGGLMIIVFLVFWCNPETFPWMKKYKDGLDKKRAACKAKCCCVKRLSEEEIQRRAEQERIRQEVGDEALHVPEIYKTEVKDFWSDDHM